jgi:hypothetical protein
MAAERTVRRDVREVREEEPVEGSPSRRRVERVEQTVTETVQTEEQTARGAESAVTNVNVTPPADDTGATAGSVTIHTPDGTQVNVNP